MRCVRVKFKTSWLCAVTISAKIFKIVVYILEMQRLLMWHEIVYSWVFLMIRFIYRATWLWFRNIGLVLSLVVFNDFIPGHGTTNTTPEHQHNHHHIIYNSFYNHTRLSSELSINTNGISKKTKIKLFPPISLCANNESSRQKLFQIIKFLAKNFHQFLSQLFLKNVSRKKFMVTENRNHGPKHKNSCYVGVLDTFYAKW